MVKKMLESAINVVNEIIFSKYNNVAKIIISLEGR